MNSRINSRFHKAFRGLSKSVQKRAREAYKTFANNPYDPRLHFKQIHPSRPIYSARIGYRYRAVGRIEGDTIIWFWIGSREDYENLL